VSRIREKQRGGETNRGTEDRQKTQHQQRSWATICSFFSRTKETTE
jgi:hypothetical protein